MMVFKRRFGAGALVMSEGGVLLQQRASIEHEPLTWGIFGGTAEDGEFAPHDCMVREVREETGIDVERLPSKLIYEFNDRSGNFSYFTYLVTLPSRVQPTLDAETHQAAWFDLGTSPADLWSMLPSPLHSGFGDLVRNERTVQSVLEALHSHERSARIG